MDDAEKKIKALEKQLAKAHQAAQAVLPEMEAVFLTELQYRFATIRARYPKSREHPDWKCLQMAGAEGTAKTLRANASRFMKNQHILKIIADSRKDQIEALELSGDKVVADLIEFKDISMGKRPAFYSVTADDGKMTLHQNYGFSHTGTKSALELLGKHLGIFKDNLELSGEVSTGPREVLYVNADNLDEVREKITDG